MEKLSFFYSNHVIEKELPLYVKLFIFSINRYYGVLLCARYCCRHWGCNGEQNRQSCCPLEVYILKQVRQTINKYVCQIVRNLGEEINGDGKVDGSSFNTVAGEAPRG